MGYVIHVCGLGLDTEARPPTTPRERYRLQHRLARVEKRLEQSRGATLNLAWLEWMDLCVSISNALGGETR